MRKLTLIAILILAPSARAGNILPTDAAQRTAFAYPDFDGRPPTYEAVSHIDPSGNLNLMDSRDPRVPVPAPVLDAAVLFPTAGVAGETITSFLMLVSMATVNGDPNYPGEVTLHAEVFASGPSLDVPSFHQPFFAASSFSVHAGLYDTPIQITVGISLVDFSGDWLGVRLYVNQSSTSRGPNAISISEVLLDPVGSVPEPSSAVIMAIGMAVSLAWKCHSCPPRRS